MKLLSQRQEYICRQVLCHFQAVLNGLSILSGTVLQMENFFWGEISLRMMHVTICG